MIKLISNISLKGKFLIITSIIVLVALGIPSAILYQYYYKTFSPMMNESYEMIVQNRVDALQKMIENVEKAAQAIHDNEDAYYTDYYSNSKDKTSDGFTLVAETIVDFEIDENGSNINTALERYHDATEFFESMLSLTCGSEEEGYYGQLIIFDEYPISNYLTDWKVSKISEKNYFVSEKNIEQTIWYPKTIEKAGDFYWFVEKGKTDMVMATKLLTYQRVNSYASR